MACCNDTNLTINIPGLDIVLAQIAELKEILMNETEQLTALSAKVDDLVADVRAALEILRAERDNFGAEGQAAFDELSAKVDAFDTEVGDADGSDTPPPVEE